MVSADAPDTPPPKARIARQALEALAFPSKWTGFGALSSQVCFDHSSGQRRSF
jgi:hypothetical protein